MGRDLFDFAFCEFSQRWKFKHPTPADFFRTMEDASGIDIDWFWRGWFYTTDHVDISLENVRHYKINIQDPEIEEAFKRKKELEKNTLVISATTTYLKELMSFQKLKISITKMMNSQLQTNNVISITI